MARRKFESSIEARKAEALRLFASNMSVHRIALEMKVDASTVSRWLKEDHLSRVLRDREERAVREKQKNDIAIAREALARVASRSVLVS